MLECTLSVISPLLRSLVHLIHNNVRDACEVRLTLQSPQQHTCGAVQQPGGRCLTEESSRGK